MSNATYAVRVDWNADGDYLDTGEDVTSRVLARQEVAIRRGRDQLSLLGGPIAGNCGFLLDNISRDYSPDNSSSPLSGNLLPQRKVNVQATFLGSIYDLVTGHIQRYTQNPRRNERSVSVQLLGSLAKLVTSTEENKISTALYQDILTSTAIGYVLDAIGFPAGDRVIGTGLTTLSFWWLHGADPFQALVDLVMTEGPGTCCYEDGSGKIHFENRHYRLLTSRSVNSQATFSDVSSSEPAFGPEFSYEDGVEGIINICRLEVKKRAIAGSVAQVWQYGASLTLGPSEARSIAVVASDPFVEAVAPQAGTDYTVTAGSLASVVLDRASGQSCTITLTAGTSGAVVTGLQLRAKAVSVTSTMLIQNTISTATSQTRYGQRPYKWPARAEIDPRVAQDFCNWIVQQYQEPRAKVRFQLVNRADSPLTQSLTREISDRITVVEPQTGLNGAFWIEQIEHKVRQAGGIHETIIGCERIIGNQTYWILGTSKLGTETRLGW